MGTEKLKFKIHFYAEMWDKPPVAEIMLNDKSFVTKEITGTDKQPDVVEFEAELNNGVDYTLLIKRTGKSKGQTVVNDNGDILKDQILGIKSIEIDEIDIGSLLYTGTYTPDYPEPWATQQRQNGNNLEESFKNASRLGHNGTWKLTFQSPFYMWLLENLY